MEVEVTERDKNLNQFLISCFSKVIQDFKPLQGDAGYRNYYRFKVLGKSYVLMDCPPTYCSIEPFIYIANYLRQNNFSAPEVIYADSSQGFLVLEDFGPLSIKHHLLQKKDKKFHRELYFLIIDLLVSLQEKTPPPALISYDNELFCSELNLFIDWYIPYSKGRHINISELKEFEGIWKDILSLQHPMQTSIVLRDYHVENMMYLKDKKGINLVGLLDFQDALIGSPVYDLVSVLEDARIEVPRKLALECIEYFAQKKNLDKNSVLLNYHILGMQRNSRILGIFARKAKRDRDNNYLQHIPLVLKYLDYDLSQKELAPLKNWIEKI